MTDLIKFSGLSSASSLAAADLIAILQGGSNKLVTAAQVLAYIQANLAANALTLIQEQLLTGDVASVTFSAIPQTYRHLKLLCYGRVTEAVTDNYIYIRFNGDSGANYDHQHHLVVNATNSIIAEYAQTKGRICDFPGASASRSTQSGACECLIPHYTGTVFEKNVITSGGGTAGTSGNGVFSTLMKVFWRSAAAITQIDILPSANNFKTGSLFSLYGHN